MTDADADADVIVVGAGFAGLSAARALAGAGLKVVVLEARNRVGGRTHTVERSGVTLDLGGQWIGPGQSHIAALADELGVDTYPQYDDGDDVVVRAGTVVRVASPALAFAKEELLGYLELVAALEALADTVPTDAPWQAPKAATLDRQTLATWIDGRGVPGAATELFEVGVQAVFAATSADLSLLHVAHYVAAAGGWSALTDTTGGAQERRIVGGLEPLARRLAEQLPGGVQLDSEVLGLDWDRDNDGVTVTVQRRAPAAVGSDLGGTMGPGGSTGARIERLRARRVIVAVPPTVAQRIAFDPTLPPARDQLMANMPGGSVIKFHVIYPTPFWRAAGLSGQVIAPGAVVGATFDSTAPNHVPDGPGVITGFFEAAHATAAGRHSQQDRRQMVVDHLVAALGEKAAAPQDYVDLDWSAEPHTRGCYGAHLPPGAWTRWGPELRHPVGPIHWAGSECATRWVGYIDGAIESGRATAAEVANQLQPNAPSGAHHRYDGDPHGRDPHHSPTERTDV